MNNKNNSAYDKASLVTLAKLYYHLNQNIEEGILSKAMYSELDLIRQAAVRKAGILGTDL